ncbi:MAG TPA: hypothetical protein VF841_16940 [Anaeromyxobacter sp.]
MNASLPGLPVPLALTVLALALAPRPARALPLLDEQLSLEGGRRPDLAVALAAAPPPGDPMDFDLLGKPPPPPDTSAEDARMRRRHRLLQIHQRVGLAMGTLELATVVTGQLNYDDKFGTANTGRYVLTHKVLAYSTFGLFAVGGTLALLAPRPADKPDRGWDRVRVHKLGMLLATAGMVAQAVVGIETRNREGYLDQKQLARTHLAIGYATLACTGIAVGALVF